MERVLDIETETLRYLTLAVDQIGNARLCTQNGLLDDHLLNALYEVQKAMKMAISQ